MTKPKNVYETAFGLGKNYLDNMLHRDNHAVMFDIDDTLIFSETNKPIKPIIKLLKECNKKGIKVLIITARPSTYKNETILDLMDVGIFPNPDIPEFAEIDYSIPKNAVFYDFIYLRHSPHENNDFFKSIVKEKLFNNGIYTIMSVGDNDIDVLGDYSGYSIKLPNIRMDDPRFDPRLFHKNAYGKMVNVKV